MKSSFILLFVFLIVMSFRAFADQTCPVKGPGQVDSYLASLADKVPDFEKILTEYDSFKKNCQALLKKHTIENCLGNFDYLKRLGTQKGIYSPLVSDQEYLNSQPKDVVALPPELLRGVPKNWEKLFREKNWQWHFFSSHERRKGDKGILKNRFVLRVPGEKVDGYYLFVTATNEPTESEAFQAIFVEKKYAGQGKNQGPRIHFRTFSNDPGKKVSLHDHSGGGRCLECHQNGPREIIPVKDQIQQHHLGKNTLVTDNQFSSGGKSGSGVERDRKKMNEYLSSYGPPNWDTFFPATGHFKGVQLGKTVGCVDCHQGETRGRLLPAIAGDLRNLPHGIEDKIIRHPTMPPETDLLPDERIDIMKEITKEYYGEMKKWLTAKKCQHEAQQSCENFGMVNRLQYREIFKGHPLSKINLKLLKQLSSKITIASDLLSKAELCQFNWGSILRQPRQQKNSNLEAPQPAEAANKEE
ncbi:MAG: hypothetical protein HN509_07885 [Halobacteriovoraceae bacterium]|jgi:hypothetical protein|nr:hypothetical protein [Halobacteriovoraceae bacterium]MBT5096143.1 hypothetical protein [Halobacteriovoraceae bacterium]